MAEKFISAGYNVTQNMQEADICIINTCSVTNIAERKSRQTIRKIKQKNPKVIMVVTGCYVQVAKKDVEQMPEVNLALENSDKKDVVTCVENFIKNAISNINQPETGTTAKIGEQEQNNIFTKTQFDDFGVITYTEKTRAVIKVQDGCDRFCSYCIIPYARGRVRSRNPESVIQEIKQIAQKGIKEVVITGIHIASYGKDFKQEEIAKKYENKQEYRLIDLLEEINKIDGIKRIRLGSIEPMLITQQFISRLLKLEKICPHFHLSLLSGCNETLSRMNRKYKVEEFEKVVEALRKAYKDVVLTTDIIVGFPGETKEEFNETYEFLKQIKFYKMHVFPYSIRKGTKAAEMENQIDGAEKERRSKILIDLSNENQLNYNKQYIGKTVQVLLEENLQGHTANYLLVKAQSENSVKEPLENCLKQVYITGATEAYLTGIIK